MDFVRKNVSCIFPLIKQQTAHEALWMAQYGAVVFEN